MEWEPIILYAFSLQNPANDFMPKKEKKVFLLFQHAKTWIKIVDFNGAK